MRFRVGARNDVKEKVLMNSLFLLSRKGRGVDKKNPPISPLQWSKFPSRVEGEAVIASDSEAIQLLKKLSVMGDVTAYFLLNNSQLTFHTY